MAKTNSKDQTEKTKILLVMALLLIPISLKDAMHDANKLLMK